MTISPAPETTTIEMLISDSSIHEMFDRMDMGICDSGSTNPIVQCLRPHLGLDSSAKLRIVTLNRRRYLQLGQERISLPEEISKWLDQAYRGMVPSERLFSIELPNSWLHTTKPSQPTLSVHAPAVAAEAA